MADRDRRECPRTAMGSLGTLNAKRAGFPLRLWTLDVAPKPIATLSHPGDTRGSPVLPAPNTRSHLLAMLLALVLASGLVSVGLWYCERLERRNIHALAPEFSDEKLQGMALQRHAFAQPDLLVLYGSSELVKEMPNNASQFFQDYPTGFRVFPVGKPGTTSLAVLQKIASVGPSVRGHKVAYSISPGWFFTETFDPKYYEGNFSALQAGELAFSARLSRGLKRDIARRMLEYPKTLENDTLLRWAIERLAGDGWSDRALFTLALPLGKLQTAVGRAQDHLETALHILEDDARLHSPARPGKRVVHWADLFKRAAQYASAPAIQAKRNEVSRKRLPRAARALRDKAFLQTIAKAEEWTDIELLLRTFQELGVQPLLLTMPVEDIRLEVYGLGPDARNAYVQRLDALAESYRFPLADFREHHADPAFLADFLDHLSGKGWLYYNKALDDFFHGRLTTL